MKKKLLLLPFITLAMIFSSTLFTTDANADHNVKRYRGHNSYGYHVKPYKYNRGHKYGHYKHHKHNKHYKKPYKYYRHNYDRYRYHRHKHDDPKFFFSLVLPITQLFNGYDNYYYRYKKR